MRREAYLRAIASAGWFGRAARFPREAAPRPSDEQELFSGPASSGRMRAVGHARQRLWRSETKAYLVAVLVVELSSVSAVCPALMAQRQVLLLGKPQADHWAPPYGRPVAAEWSRSQGLALRHFHRRRSSKGRKPGYQKQRGHEADKQPPAARTQPRHRKKRAHS
jgi:hypothetical protein